MEKLPPEVLEYGKEVVERLKNEPAPSDVTEEERERLGKKGFEYEGSKFKKFVLFRPAIYASRWYVEDPQAVDYMKIGWIDEKGRRCFNSIPKKLFEFLFVEV